MRHQKDEDLQEDIGSPVPSNSLGEGLPNCTPWTGLGRERDGHGKGVVRLGGGGRDERGSDVRPGIANQRLA